MMVAKNPTKESARSKEILKEILTTNGEGRYTSPEDVAALGWAHCDRGICDFRPVVVGRQSVTLHCQADLRRTGEPLGIDLTAKSQPSPRCTHEARLFQSGGILPTGWPQSAFVEPETTAFAVLLAIEDGPLTAKAIVEVSGLTPGAVHGALRRLTHSKSGPAWVERIDGYSAFRAVTLFEITPRGRMRLRADRESMEV